MDITEIISNAVKYPFSDIKTLLIIGGLCLIGSIFGSLNGFTDNSAIVVIGSIISLIFAIIIAGYQLDIIKFGINLEESMPALDIKNNFINGIKNIVVFIVYYIIPTIIVSILGFALGGFAIMGLSNFNATGKTPAEVASAMFTPQVVSGLAIVIIIAIILFVLFTLLALMGQCRLAKTGNLGNALSFSQSYNELREIGIGKTLGLVVLLYIIVCIALLVFFAIMLIPYVGIILVTLFGQAIIMFVQCRSYGLLYSEL